MNDSTRYASGMEMPRDEWLRRFRARYKVRRSVLSEEYLDEIASLEAHEALSGEYPNEPELAADVDLDSWPEMPSPNEAEKVTP